MRWACALMLSGCSFIGVHVPASGPIERPNGCASSLPDLDAFGAIVSVGIVASNVAGEIVALDNHLFEPSAFVQSPLDTATKPLLVTAALTGASALYGFHEVQACRDHVDDVAARMQVDALAAARAGRCDEVVEVRTRLERIGRDLDMRDPSTKACFPYYCASGEAGFCACSHSESDCEPAVKTGLAPACVPERVDICTATPATRAR